MSRLINADEIKRNYTQVFADKYGRECAEMFHMAINQTPTAYNKEKVVAELEDFMDEAKQFNVSGMVADMIEVVRKGGVE